MREAQILTATHAAEVRQMFVLYLPVEDIRKYVIMTRSKQFGLAGMYDNESAWMVRGTVSADDQHPRSSATLRPSAAR
jgi:hypothetical protein